MTGPPDSMKLRLPIDFHHCSVCLSVFTAPVVCLQIKAVFYFAYLFLRLVKFPYFRLLLNPIFPPLLIILIMIC
jgi:hypothetical protein